MGLANDNQPWGGARTGDPLVGVHHKNPAPATLAVGVGPIAR